MNLAQYSLDNTKIVYFFLAVLLIGGILSFGRLGKKEDAPFVIKSAVIMTRYPGAEPAGGRKINCVMRRFFPSSSVGDRPAPRGCTSTPDERKVTTI